jgi:demethylmenaquinone methyltransferase/2-methoxy-6-polyprenyl-1,4-benzoquinol methylase
MRDANAPADPAVHPPHPVLPHYYDRADQREGFVRDIFDRTAGDYERIERIVGLGMGSRYRREALLRAGLKSGMRVLDVATGTGLVIREALAILGDTPAIVGLDRSGEMMRSGLKPCAIPLVQGSAERLPFADAQFDFISLGFALRHMSDLRSVFGEFRRVLRPGGIVCMLEITPPERPWQRNLLKFYLKRVVPLLSRALARNAETPQLFRYFWDTIEACVPPAQVLEALELEGLTAAHRHVEVRVFSEYTARR